MSRFTMSPNYVQGYPLPSIQVDKVDHDYHHQPSSINYNAKVQWTTSPPLPTVQQFPTYNFTFQSEHSPLFSSSSFASPTFLSPTVGSSPSPSGYAHGKASHRKAPSPPAYSPRRARARHIKMQEPAKLGLFTVEEESNPIGERGRWYRDTRSSLSTPCSLTPSSTTSTCSSSGSVSEDGEEVSTPLMEQQDPFALFPSPFAPFSTPRSTPVSSRSSPNSVPTLAAAVNAGTFRPRRPPPLALSLITGPETGYNHEPPIISPTPMAMMLAPALPISDTGRKRSSNSPQKRNSPDEEVDLVLALEELLTTCGEDLSGSDSSSESSFGADSSTNSIDSFPMPPSRYLDKGETAIHPSSPRTPPPTLRRAQHAPLAPKQKSRKMSGSNNIRVGRHTFLQGLSLTTGTDESGQSSDSASNSQTSRSRSSSSSLGSGSLRSLPRRGVLPTEWRTV